MIKIFKAILVVFCLTPFMLEAKVSQDEVEIKKELRQASEDIIKIASIKNISLEQKHIRLAKIADRLFDYKIVARIVLGKKYKKLTKAQRKQYLKLFKIVLEESYISKFDSYTNQKIYFKEVDKIKKNKFIANVIIQDGSNNMKLQYKLYKPKKPKKNKNRYLIYDVNIMGISLVRSYSLQFKQLVDKHGVDGFLKQLEKKVKKKTKK